MAEHYHSSEPSFETTPHFIKHYSTGVKFINKSDIKPASKTKWRLYVSTNATLEIKAFTKK